MLRSVWTFFLVLLFAACVPKIPEQINATFSLPGGEEVSGVIHVTRREDGTYSGTFETTTDEPTEPSPAPGLAAHDPAVDLGPDLYVGAGVAADDLPAVIIHDGVGVSYGTVRDGTGSLTTYLTDNADSLDYIRRFNDDPPVVRFSPMSDELRAEAIRAVRIINASLPKSYQLQIGDEVTTPEVRRPPDGEIWVDFAPRSQWPLVSQPDSVGISNHWFNATSIVGGHVWIDHEALTDPDQRLVVAVHEILHTLGRNHPTPGRFPNTVMNSVPVGAVGHVLHPLDREALLAVYGRLDRTIASRDVYAELGPWSEDSTHLRGDLDEMSFGVARRNGLTQAWATGPKPLLDLNDPGLTPAEVAGQHAEVTSRRQVIDDELAAEQAAIDADQVEIDRLNDEWPLPIGSNPLATLREIQLNQRRQAFNLRQTEAEVQYAELDVELANIDLMGERFNTPLPETVRWSGQLLGMTPTEQSVAGRAGLSVQLTTLQGNLNFDSLEHWQGQPSEMGSGQVWRDGSLAYDIAVTGNGFVQTGGDDGVVTGAFFGRQHEMMGGTLDRSDLTAAFGGKR